VSAFLRISIAAVLLAAPVAAQRGGGGGRGGNSPGMDIQMPRVTSRLDQIGEMFKLSKEQKKEVKSIFDEAQKSAIPVREEMTKGRQAIAEAIAGGKSQEEIDKLTQSYSLEDAQMVAIENKAFAKAVNLLEPEQKQRAGLLFRMMPGMFNKKNWENP
jgi:hypothetical protein